MKLREHQKHCIEALRESLSLNSPVIVSAPCGFGKTIVFCEISKRLISSGNRMLIIMDSVDLVKQTKDKMKLFVDESHIGICCGTLKEKEVDTPIVIGTIQTVTNLDIKEFDFVVLDEAHSGIKRFSNFIDKMNVKQKIIGFTATPYNAKGIAVFGADKFFEKMVYECSVESLVTEGFLVPFVYQEIEENIIDTSHLKVTNKGDFNEKEVQALYSENADKISLQISDMVDKSFFRKKILIMGTGIAHAEKINLELRHLGFKSTSYHSEMNREERDIALDNFKNKDTTFLVGVSAIYKGLDIPAIDCIVIMRPIASKPFYVQFVGRGSRIFDGKKDCLILDYGKVIERLGFFESIKPSKNKKESASNEKEAKESKKCPKCFFTVKITMKECLNCGHEFKAEINIDTIEKMSTTSFVPVDLSVVKTDGIFDDKIEFMTAKENTSSKGHKQIIVDWGSPLILTFSNRYRMLLTDNTDYDWMISKNKKIAKKISNGHTDNIFDLPEYFSKPENWPFEIKVNFDGKYVKEICYAYFSK